jgi:hypothetical protein
MKKQQTLHFEGYKTTPQKISSQSEFDEAVLVNKP